MKRKTLGQIAWLIAQKHNQEYADWDRCSAQAEYEDIARAVAKEVLRRAKAVSGAHVCDLKLSDVK